MARDQLWITNLVTSETSVLTSGPSVKSNPFFSPDGNTIAYSASVGAAVEVHTLDLKTASDPERKTNFGESARVVGWLGDEILFTSAARRPFVTQSFLYAGDRCFGSGVALATSSAHGSVLCRYEYLEAAKWKRYRGGSRGDFWIDRGANRAADADAKPNFRPLRFDFDGNLSRPCWIGDSLFFLSDHEGVGHVYSRDFKTQTVRRWTPDSEFYCRHLSTDGMSLVFMRGGQIFRLDPQLAKIENVVIELPPSSAGEIRKTTAADDLQDFTLDFSGSQFTAVVRGHLVATSDLSQPMKQIDAANDEPSRLVKWVGYQRLLSFRETVDKSLAILRSPEVEIDLGDVGRVLACEVRPNNEGFVLANHRNELIYFDLKTRTSAVIDRGAFELIDDAVWSCDGRSVAYSVVIAPEISVIKLWDFDSKQTRALTQPHLRDRSPAFDPSGSKLYFLSERRLSVKTGSAGASPSVAASWQPCVYDLSKGTFEVLPLPPGSYPAIWASRDSCIYFDQRNHVQTTSVYRWNLTSASEDTLLENVTTAQVSVDGAALAALTTDGLKIMKLDAKTSQTFDLSQVEIQYDQRVEWRNLLLTAWALQRDFFYDPGMNGKDWRTIWERYSSLLPSIGSRSDCSDLIWELNGELETSHAYEIYSARLLPTDTKSKNERPLRYHEWRLMNRRTVETKTGGRVGYIHVPNTNEDGFGEFHLQFLQQSQTHALILDLRYNSGGHLGESILDRLTRVAVGRTISRGSTPTSFPPHTRSGPLIVLINGFTGSDGEQLAELLRRERDAVLIGEPTWGGVTGARGHTSLVGGGRLTQPRTVFEIKGAAPIENRGVSPDNLVEMSPQDETQGRDPQLDCAIVEALKV